MGRRSLSTDESAQVDRLFVQVEAVDLMRLFREVRVGFWCWSASRSIGFRVEPSGFGVRVDLEDDEVMRHLLTCGVVELGRTMFTRTDEDDDKVVHLSELVPSPELGTLLFEALSARGL
ncbi:hypothetical protein [Saccharothrix stipae]